MPHGSCKLIAIWCSGLTCASPQLDDGKVVSVRMLHEHLGAAGCWHIHAEIRHKHTVAYAIAYIIRFQFFTGVTDDRCSSALSRATYNLNSILHSLVSGRKP